MLKASTLLPMFFPIQKLCITCQKKKIASAFQILPNSFTKRQLYYCADCATERGFPPDKNLLKRIERRHGEQTKSAGQPRQKQAKARGRRK
jgi:protein-arginine kinase activator protein McsA